METSLKETVERTEKEAEKDIEEDIQIVERQVKESTSSLDKEKVAYTYPTNQKIEALPPAILVIKPPLFLLHCSLKIPTA